MWRCPTTSSSVRGRMRAASGAEAGGAAATSGSSAANKSFIPSLCQRAIGSQDRPAHGILAAMKTLLAAVDFSDASRKVVAFVEDLARELSARVILLHVVEPVASYVPVGAAMDVIETAPPPIMEEDLKAQQGHLERLAAGLKNAQTVATIGLAADEIVSQAAQHGADFIVLGSHGHGALYHLFAGSVVTGVLKRSRIPVIVVPIGERVAKSL
jgi:nucleotide-binding universal stress UspA family protein